MRQLLVAQDNVIALRQLPGAQRRSVRRAAEIGEWRALSWQVYLASPNAASRQQLLWAAVLHGGPGARLCGRNALVLHGWNQELKSPYDVLIPHAVQPKRPPEWLRLHRTVREISGPAATPARTSPHVATVHAAAWADTDRAALFVVISSLQQRLTSVRHLLSSVDAMPKLRRRALIVEAAKEYADGVQSLNELDFGRWCQRFDLPVPIRQTRVRDAAGRLRALDVEFRTASGESLRLEIEGLHHLDPAQYFADITRHNDLAVVRAGMSLRVTTWHLRHEGAAFASVLRQALAF